MQPRTIAYRPTIRLVDIHRGLYTVTGSDGHTVYAVDVKHTACTCKAGQTGFRGCKTLPYCKHVAAAKWWAKCLHDSRLLQPQPASAGAAGLLEAFGM